MFRYHLLCLIQNTFFVVSRFPILLCLYPTMRAPASVIYSWSTRSHKSASKQSTNGQQQQQVDIYNEDLNTRQPTSVFMQHREARWDAVEQEILWTESAVLAIGERGRWMAVMSLCHQSSTARSGNIFLRGGNSFWRPILNRSLVSRCIIFLSFKKTQFDCLVTFGIINFLTVKI